MSHDPPLLVDLKQRINDLQKQITDRDSQILSMRQDIIRLQDEVNYLRSRNRGSDDQFHQIAQFLGGDATSVVDPECEKTIAGLVKQEVNKLQAEVKEWQHRAVGGTCRILSNPNCDCSLCSRDREIKLLQDEAKRLAKKLNERNLMLSSVSGNQSVTYDMSGLEPVKETPYGHVVNLQNKLEEENDRIEKMKED